MANWKFGDKVRKISGRDVFVVLGREASGKIQIAALNWKTAAKDNELERA
jgi:hypothetical protein